MEGPAAHLKKTEAPEQEIKGAAPDQSQRPGISLESPVQVCVGTLKKLEPWKPMSKELVKTGAFSKVKNIFSQFYSTQAMSSLLVPSLLAQRGLPHQCARLHVNQPQTLSDYTLRPVHY